ncbi:MAG: nucleotidyltransferase domain-containing protein [Nitrospirae bacterium]|nr:nucleotidyltransferase domain-containing protein [Nitrospirota bacterium]
MKLEHYPVERLKKDLLAIFGKHLNLRTYRVFFFGSRVQGKGTDRSDVDVGIEGPEPVPAAQWAAIQDEDEVEDIPTLYKVDLVDFGRVVPQFREVAFQHIEPITA